MMNDIEDYLYAVKELHGIPLTASDLDLILDRVVQLARRRDRL
jgi:hypothetical protein